MGNEKPADFDALLRTVQIIVFALVSGVVMFMAIVLLFMGAGVQPFDTGAVVSMVMAAFGASAILARLLVPGLMVDANCRRIAQGSGNANQRHPGAKLPDTDEGKLMQVFLTKTIVGSAFLEGGAFANLIAFMLEGQIYSIVLSVLLLLGILAGFPTRSGLSEWLETQSRRLREMHM